MANAQDQLDQPPPYSPSDPNGPPLVPPRSPGPAFDNSSSTSLLPLQTLQFQDEDKRKLLLIYIHGFMGNETSFQSFPVHVHNMVSALLSDIYAVHTKIYPKYRSKKSIEVAVTDFSAWLAPHESPTTDVILLGHSMGGLLTAEMVLRPATDQSSGSLRHRIIGTISFDTPFLGMHPGIIKSGLGSLFRAEPDPPSGASSEMPPVTWPQDPNYNQPFFNDVHLPVRAARRNAAHFMTKHSNQLRTATSQLITSHIEFGQCLMDFNGLRVRYCRIRILEEDEENRRQGVIESATPPPRVRFVNYYTASTGRPKKANLSETEDPTATPRRQSASLTDAQDSVAEAHLEGSPENNLSSTTETAVERRVAPLTEKHPISVEDDSDEDSEISDLTDLDPLDDLESHFDDSMSVVDATGDDRPTSPLQAISRIKRRPVPTGPYPVEKGSSLPPIPTRQSDTSLPGYSAPLKSISSELSETSLTYEVEDLEHPGPIPSSEEYEDEEYYRAVLSEHGRISKLYFAEARKRQTKRYSEYITESKARTAKLNQLLTEEANQLRQTIAEQAKVMVDTQAEETRSKIEHSKAIAVYKQRTMSASSKAGSSVASSSKTQQKLERRQTKMEEKLTKADRKVKKARFKIAEHQAKMEKKSEKAARKFGVRCDSVAESSSSSAGLRTATVDHIYNVNTAPISNTIRPLGTSNGSTTSFDTASSYPTASTMTSDLSLDNATAGPSALSPQYSGITSASISSLTSTPKKDKVFCVLPPADGAGNRDPCWERVYMENMDEVSAHTGLFFSRGAGEVLLPGKEWSERYTKMVCDVAERVEQWVGEDLSRRMAEGLEGH